jgi:DNA-binding response OmpR family regulator
MSGKVLIVEDEAYLAGLLSDVLQAAGYEVELATPSRAAEKVVETRPVAIVMDYLLPGLNGAQVVERIRGAMPDRAPPVILVTGLSNARELAGKVGADAYLRKPFDVDALVNLVNRFADRQP